MCLIEQYIACSHGDDQQASADEVGKEIRKPGEEAGRREEIREVVHWFCEIATD